MEADYGKIVYCIRLFCYAKELINMGKDLKGKELGAGLLRRICDVIGNMIISEEKPLHCQKVLSCMEEKYKGSTMEQCRITMASMFFCAVENQIIPSSYMYILLRMKRKSKNSSRHLK